MIVVEGLRVVYKDVISVLHGISLRLENGKITTLLGANGAGKTTTFYMIVGMIKPNGGQVYLNSTDITELPMYKRAKMGIGYLPQEASVFRRLSVEDNIMAVLEMLKMSKTIRGGLSTVNAEYS